MRLSEANRVRLLYFFTFCCQAAWLPRFADYLTGMGLAGGELGAVLSIPPVMMFLVQPIYGHIADRVGFKKTLVLGALLAAVFFLGFLVRGGFWWVAFVTVAMSLFYNATQPIIDSMALRAVDRDPGFSYGGLRIAGAAAWSFMGVVNGYLVDRFAIGVIFVVAAVAMGATFLFALASSPIPPKKGVAAAPSTFLADLRSLFRSRFLVKFLLIATLVSVASTAIWNFYSLFMKEIGATDSLTGWGFTIQGLCELPFFYFSSKIIARFGLNRVLLVTLMATALRLCLYGWVNEPHWALTIELLHGISWSLFWVVCVEMTDRAVRDEWKATGQSLLYAAYFGIGAIGGNFWTSFLVEKMKLGPVFLLNAGIVGVAAVAAFLFLKDEK